MPPSTLLCTTGLLLALSIPLSANAVVMKTNRITARDTNQLQYASSSSRRNIPPSSSSSAPYIDTIRSKDAGITFKMPNNWKALYDRDGVSFRLERSSVAPYQASFLSVTRKKLSKPQTLKLIYKTILDKATIDAAGANLTGPDFYIPSFALTGSGITKVQGIDALSLSFTGEFHSEQFSYKRVDFVKDNWQYTIWLATLPQYVKEDVKVFEGVVGSLGLEKNVGTKSQ